VSLCEISERVVTEKTTLNSILEMAAYLSLYVCQEGFELQFLSHCVADILRQEVYTRPTASVLNEMKLETNSKR